MATMDGWDWILLIAGCYLAVTALCRLMSARRARVIDQLSAEAARQRRLPKPKIAKDKIAKEKDASGRAA